MPNTMPRMNRGKWYRLRHITQAKRKATPTKRRTRPKAVRLTEHNIKKLARRLKRGTI